MEVVVLGFVALFVLVFIGVPLGFGLMLVGLGGFAVVRGIEPGLAMAGQQILDIDQFRIFRAAALYPDGGLCASGGALR